MRNKKLLIIFLAGLIFLPELKAQTITTPQSASPAAEVSQTIGISTISITYSRPAVKGREIWGQLVPYGYINPGFGSATEAPWRAGANENTTISFSHNAQVEGKDIPAGTYGLFVALDESGKADVIFSKNSTSWGSYFYDQAEDQLRVQVQTEEIPHTERLTYDFVDLTKNDAVVALDWEKKRIPFKVAFDVDNIVLANARNQLRNTAGFGWQGPLSAANYCYQNNINHEEAISWASQALANTDNFNGHFIKGGLLMQSNRESEALQEFDLAAELANTNQLNFVAYQFLQKENYDKALEYFKMNVDRNPKSALCHDSLGECYMAMGNNKLAIKEFKKSLSLSPQQRVKTNSIKNLKSLGVDTSEYEKGE